MLRSSLSWLIAFAHSTQPKEKVETPCSHSQHCDQDMQHSTMIRLLGFEELGQGREIPVLSKSTTRIREKYVRFPEESENLKIAPVYPIDLDSPRFSLFTFDRATLHGFRTYSLGNNKFFSDHSLVESQLADSRFRERLAVGNTENVKLADDGSIATTTRTITVDATDTLILVSDEPPNFGSWIFRIFPKLLLTPPTTKFARVMVYAKQPWMRDVLAFVAPGASITENNPVFDYDLRNPTIPSLVTAEAFLRREIIEAFDTLIERSTPATSTHHDKIYISRRRMALSRLNYRTMENETELVVRLAEHGYKEFIPEDFSLPEQIAIVSRAKVIVSAGGSNLYLCAFARNADIILDIEAANTFQYVHSNLLASTNIPFAMVFGTRLPRGAHAHHMNWIVDVDCVLRGLAKLGVL